jgi:hypothetical protein
MGLLPSIALASNLTNTCDDLVVRIHPYSVLDTRQTTQGLLSGLKLNPRD